MKLDEKTATAIVNNYLEFRDHIVHQIGMYNSGTDVPVVVNEGTITMLYRLYTDKQRGLWK